MSRTNSQINYIISAQDAGASSTFGKIANEMDRLKANLGGRGPLKDALELLVGGGAVAGLGFALRMQADLTKAIDATSDAYMRGQKSAAQFGYEVAKSIPIISSMVDIVEASGRTIGRFFGVNLPSISDSLQLINEMSPERQAERAAEFARRQRQQNRELRDRRRRMGDKADTEALLEFYRFAEEARRDTERDRERERRAEMERIRAFNYAQRSGANFLFAAEMAALQARIQDLPNSGGGSSFRGTAPGLTGAGNADVVAAVARPMDAQLSEVKAIRKANEEINRLIREMNDRGRKYELASASVQGIFQVVN